VHILNKLSVKFKIYWAYIDQTFAQYGSIELSARVLQFSNQQEIDFILLDIEFYLCFHLASIDLLRTGKPKLGILLFDDGPLHSFNQISASRADFVTTGCPLSNYKYQEIGMRSTWLPLESDSLYHCQTEEKPIDVLFFGHSTKCDRPEYLSALTKVTGISTVVFDSAIDGQLDHSSLARLLTSAKVIINLTKTEFNDMGPKISRSPSSLTYQLKGRIHEALFSGAVCISEFAPQHHLLNIDGYLGEFKTPEELIDRLTSFDFREPNFKRIFDEFYRGCWSIYCDASVMERFYHLVNQVSSHPDSTFTRSRERIDDRYFSIVRSAINDRFAHNPDLCRAELNLLEQCE
jgi:hypothetical protein